MAAQRSGADDERAAILRRIDEGIDAGPFAPDWDLLSAAYQVPDWYVDGKFGIFVHWGPYCVPGFANEWYPREMYRSGTAAFEHHRATFGPHDRFGYKDFIAGFTGTAFDPVEWATLFRRAGAQFVVPVAEHHDGFVMYDTALSRWNAATMGPRRDVVGELSDAVRAQSMVAGASTHRAEHWWFFNGGMRFDSDVRDPAYADFYGPAQREEIRPSVAFLEDWLARTVEIVEHNRAQLIWFDWWIEQDVFKPWLAKFAAWYYNWGVANRRPVAINYKFDAFAPGSAVFDVERGQQAGARPMLWQNDTSVAVSSWGWIEGQRYKDVRVILGDLMDVVAKNGALLLNVGPRPDGSFEAEEIALLHRIGDWLSTNGEAVYGTRPYVVTGEGPTQVADSFLSDENRVDFTAADVRFTARADVVYATLLRWPADGRVAITSLAGPDAGGPAVATVELLGSPGQLEFSQSADGLRAVIPPAGPDSLLPVLKIIPQDRIPDARKYEVRN